MSVLWDCFDNFRARKMNIILPVAGSGDFSRLSIISTASQRSLLPVRARTGLAGATVGPHVTWRKGGLCPSCSSVQGSVPRPEVQAQMDGKLHNKNVSKLDLQWYLDRGWETQGRNFLHVSNFVSRAGSWGPSSTTWTPPFVSSLLNQDCPLGKVMGCGFGGLCPALRSWHLGTGRGASMLPVTFSPSFKGVLMALSFTSSSLHLFSSFSYTSIHALEQ